MLPGHEDGGGGTGGGVAGSFTLAHAVTTATAVYAKIQAYRVEITASAQYHEWGTQTVSDRRSCVDTARIAGITRAGRGRKSLLGTRQRHRVQGISRVCLAISTQTSGVDSTWAHN